MTEPHIKCKKNLRPCAQTLWKLYQLKLFFHMNINMIKILKATFGDLIDYCLHFQTLLKTHFA